LPLRGLGITCIVILTLLLTLCPGGDHVLRPFSFSFSFDLHAVADDLANVGLFVPLGLVLGWNRQRVGFAFLCGLLLSTTIELSQTVIPGRDPSVSDIVFNTLGTGLGALLGYRPQVWLDPSKNGSIALMVASIATAVSVMIATTFARPMVGQGWEFILHSQRMTPDWRLALNGVWMMALGIPIGFWARGRLLPSTAVVMAVLLASIPALRGTNATSFTEWLGMAAGLLAGTFLQRLARSVART
jgi:hypothetical protein